MGLQLSSFRQNTWGYRVKRTSLGGLFAQNYFLRSVVSKECKPSFDYECSSSNPEVGISTGYPTFQNDVIQYRNWIEICCVI